ncbi:hypothetical protein OC846_006358 [Tilletia horrida]|uniref:Carrier domain-containing protein n=1 Tax=Tilletia horrida TaxID=155126 RepID=A0AAN6GL58_9BASI|nr:hypothetical protein OC846_006358 [Tilletia horrida]KAK0559069.1 hypothetical protein OC861_006757 [Tilletia horrida]
MPDLEVSPLSLYFFLAYGDLDRIAIEYAQLISNQIGPRGDSSTQASDNTPVIAMLGPSGPEFLAHTLGIWRLGAAILPIAVGTGAHGIANLLNLTSCQHLIVHQSLRELAAEATASLGSVAEVRLLPWQSMKDDGAVIKEGQLTSSPDGGPSPLHDLTPESPLVIFHSSGSTGNPKPIPQLHRFWTRSLTTAMGRDQAAFTTTPLFHGGLSDLFRALQAAAPIYFFGWNENKAAIVSNIVSSVKACPQPIRYFLSVPYLLELLAKDEHGQPMLQAMDMVSTGGAPLSPTAGDIMVKEQHIRLVSRLGSSECGFLMSSWRDFSQDKEWSWLRINDEHSKAWLRFEPQSSESEQFELVVTGAWPTKITSNRQDGAFATGDLYERHPSHSHLWRYAGRADDVLVLANGKKVASSTMEAVLKTSPVVADAIVFGADRPMVGAIICPSANAQQLSERELLKELRPVLQQLNSQRSAHEQLAPEMVLPVDEDLFQSLPRSSKGTLQRGIAMQKIAHLVDSLYSRFERGEAPSIEEKIGLDSTLLQGTIKRLVAEVADRDLEEDDDFFAAGIDSVKAALIRARLLQRLDLKGLQLPSNIIYDCGNVKRILAFLRAPDSQSGAQSGDLAKELAERYTLQETSASQDSRQAPREARQGPGVVLVTGGTGALGARIISHLLNTSDAQIVCLARASDDQRARERILLALSTRKCTPSVSGWEDRLRCVSELEDACSMVREAALSSSSLVIIHCAWMVNFAVNLSSFERECVQPLHELLQLHRDVGRMSKFVFCSSVASILGSKPPHTESGGYGFECAGKTGYGQSKWVAEQMCAHVPGVVIARVGQLCGDTQHGIWNETEAFPLLIRTAVEVGCLPSTGPSLDWLPVDVAAEAIVEIGLGLVESSSTTEVRKYVHVALPARLKRPAWSDLIEWLSSSDILNFEPCSKAAWLEKVRDAGTCIRGRALVEDIWKHLPEFPSEPTVSTTQAEEASPALSKAIPVDKALSLKFVNAWKESGFFLSS